LYATARQARLYNNGGIVAITMHTVFFAGPPRGYIARIPDQLELEFKKSLVVGIKGLDAKVN
jgi:hypothetical protein